MLSAEKSGWAGRPWHAECHRMSAPCRARAADPPCQSPAHWLRSFGPCCLPGMRPAPGAHHVLPAFFERSYLTMTDSTPTDSTPPATVAIALVRDLMFSSKISAEARAAGAVVRIMRDPAQLADADAPLLLVDLNQEGALEPAAAWGQARPGRRVVGFVSHVDVE